MTFFPATSLQAIIQNTGGVVVVYRGQEAYFHCENPSDEYGFTEYGSVQGIVKLLIGDSTVFPNLEENTLITVDGDDYLVGEWKTNADGGVIYIALKTTLRT